MRKIFTVISIVISGFCTQAQTYISHFSLEGQTQDPFVNSFDILPNGNIIVPAIIDTNVTFFPGAINIYQEAIVKNPGSVITCVSPSNTVLWTKKWFPENYMNDFFYTYQTVHDETGNIYVGARYVGKVDVDPGPGQLFFQPDSINSTEACIIKLDSSGQFIWAKKIDDIVVTNGSIVQDVSSIYFNQMQWLPNGNLSIVGNFNGTYDFDPGSGTNIMSTLDPYVQHGFVLELDSSFNFVNAEQLKGNWCSISSMYTDNNNSHYILYNYTDTLDLSFTTATNIQIGQGMGYNNGLAKFDANYDLLWSKHCDTNLIPTRITPTLNGKFYLLSNYSGTVVLNNAATASAIGSGDISIDKFNSDGTIQWTKTIAGKGSNYGLDLKYNTNGLLLLHMNNDSTYFNTGSPTSIFTDYYNMVVSLFDTSLVHIATGIFLSNSDNYTFSSEIGLSNNQVVIKMYVNGVTDLDPGTGTILFSPAYTSNNPVVFAHLNLNTFLSVSPVNKDKFTIYPNPTNGIINIETQDQDYSIKIVNLIGQVVYFNEFKATQSAIDVANLAKGGYIITLENNKYKYSAVFQKY